MADEEENELLELANAIASAAPLAVQDDMVGDDRYMGPGPGRVVVDVVPSADVEPASVQEAMELAELGELAILAARPPPPQRQYAQRGWELLEHARSAKALKKKHAPAWPMKRGSGRGWRYK